MAELEIVNVHASYGSKEVLRDISLQLREGELCGLIGLNGSGKTTLLNCVLNFNTYEGSIFIDGLKNERLNEKERAKKVAYIPQVASPLEGKSLLQVVLMAFNPYLSWYTNPNAQMIETAKNLLNEFHFGEDVHKDFQSLSGGEQQLVLFARALLQDTPFLLFDEPDSALDFNNKHWMLNTIREKIKASGKTGLITLHDPTLALEYCDKLFLLKKGKIIHVIEPQIESTDTLSAKLSELYYQTEVKRINHQFFMMRKRWEDGKDNSN